MPYFHYRALEELRADVAARGVDVQFADDAHAITTPAEVGGLRLANRMAVHPMEGCDGNLDGTPGELTFRRWRRFAEGGAALLWGEATAVVPEGRANARQLLLTAATAGEMKRLLDESRMARRARWGTLDGFVAGIQLTHSGRWSHRAPVVARRDVRVDDVRGAGVAPIADGELERLQERYVDAAVLARDIGFDFVDVKQCHTYLLNELLGGRSREGQYGGDFDGRTRFVRELFARLRGRLGDSIQLATRLNLYDGVPYRPGDAGVGKPVASDGPGAQPWGTRADDHQKPDLSEPLRLIRELRPLGLAMVNASMGSPYFNPHIGRPFERPPVDGYTPPEHPLSGVERHFKLTAEVQRAFPDLPVVGTGYSWLRHYAMHAGAKNVEAGDVTLVGLGRGALAYPDFAADVVAHGAMERDKSCIGVSYCTALMRAKHNELGQYETGCVPRDRLYAEKLKAARVSEGWV